MSGFSYSDEIKDINSGNKDKLPNKETCKAINESRAGINMVECDDLASMLGMLNS